MKDDPRVPPEVRASIDRVNKRIAPFRFDETPILDAAPSEEFVLYCDVVGCSAALSMVSGVPREEHDWGRASLYGHDDGGDYDLCPAHYKEIKAVLGREKKE